VPGPPQESSAWNLPNALTVLRLLLVPVFTWLLLREDGTDALSQLLAVLVFIGAMVTDFVDGKIARDRGLVTSFGKIADPIADKALIGAALIGLSVLDRVPWWVTAVILLREVGVTLLRFVVIRHGIMPAGRGGKTKTALQTVTLVLLMAPLPASWSWVTTSLLVATVVVTVVTGLDYLASAVMLRRTSDRTAGKKAAKAAKAGTADAARRRATGS
jgi:CDP-diacylglycerol---glycerol-3-phosphate 3-phosphatidyltransferase